MLITRATLDLSALRATVSGAVTGPDDERYDEARAAWQLVVDQRPAVVVEAESAEDVAAAVRFARTHGLRVAPQGTGHNASPMGSLEGTLLLKTHRMRGVEVDADDRRARVEAGALWMDVAPVAAEHGLAALAGSSPDVGVVGYSLGGGIGWMAREYGMATNSILAIELVTADGRHVRTDADNDPALFWAMRGGGGNFGVVTALEFRLYPVATVYAGMMAWPIERGAEIMKAWTRWAAEAPREVTTSIRLISIPPMPDIPEIVRGKSFVMIDGAVRGDEAHGVVTLAALRELGPELDTFGVIPAAALQHIHMDPEHPVPALSDHTMVSGLDDATIDRLVETAGIGAGSPLMLVELRQLGGALAEAPEGAGALATLDADFAYFALGVPMDPGVGAAIEAHLPLVREVLADRETGRAYGNFSERPSDLSRMFDDVTYHRLAAVKDRFDPQDVFQANLPIRSGA